MFIADLLENQFIPGIRSLEHTAYKALTYKVVFSIDEKLAHLNGVSTRKEGRLMLTNYLKQT